jgi:hypothetical protein
LLTSDRPNEANDIANYAFYSLVLGVVIQVGVAVKEGRRHPRSSNSSPPDSS